MATTLILVCHLERIGPSYVASDEWVDYWLGLNCGYEGNTPTEDEAKLLRTWLWSGFKAIHVAGLKVGDDVPETLNAADVKLLEVPTGWVNATMPFLDRLQKTFEASVTAGLPSFVLNAKPQLDQKSLPWTAFLGSTSTWPGGLNDWARTSVHFRIKKAANDSYEKLIAAPVFSGPDPFGAERSPLALTGLSVSDPNSAVQSIASTPPLYEWAYEAGTAALKSRQQECLTVLDPGNDPSVDMATLHPPAGLASPGDSTDWTEDLDVALAEVFDLPRLLLRVLRKRLSSGMSWAFDLGFHELFLASLRDIANLGRAPGVDSSRLSQWLLEKIKHPNDDSKLAALDQPDLSTWKAQVAEALLKVQKTESFNDGELIVMTDGKKYLAALEQLHDRLERQETIAALLVPQWTTALGLNAPAESLLHESIELVQLRKRMLLGSLGPAWRTLSFKTAAEFKLQVTAGIEQYVKQRGVTSTGAGYLSFYPRIATQPGDLAALATEAAAIAGEMLDDRVLPRPYQGDAPDQQAEGLLIPIGAFRTAPTDAAGDRQDSHRRVAGAGVFLKPDDDSAAWTMLNYALIVDEDGTPLVAKPVPIPLKLQYRNGVSNPNQLYLNRPLAAAASEQDEYVFEHKSGDFPPSFLLENPYGSGASDPKLAGLAYGRWYRAWVHHMGKGGNLPGELTQRAVETNLPWQLVEPAAGSFAGEYTKLRFTRRTAIGALRIPTKFPEIPRDIHTIRDSLFQGASTVSANPQTPPKPSLLLLAPDDASLWNGSARRNFSFDVYRPSVDRDIWRRWIGYDPSTLELREYVRTHWNEVNRKTDRQPTDDAIIDDPAVYAIELETKRAFGPGAHPPAKSYLLPFPKRPPFDPNAKSWDAVKGKPWHCKVLTAAPGTAFAPNIDQVNHTLTIAVPEGELWEFRLRPRAKASDKDRFHPQLWPYVAEGETGPAHGEVHLMVEVATTWATATLDTTRTELHQALTPTLQKEKTLQMKFTPTGLSAHLVHRVDLMVQRWRWDGRPVYRLNDRKEPQYGYPFDSDPSGIDTLPLDGALFGGRDSSDRYELTKDVDFVCTPPHSGVLEERDLSSMPGALYYRFALRAYSRYAPWLKTDSLETLTVTLNNKSREERWRRLAVPCRYRGKLPRPALRLILPLTMSGDAHNPKLLLLLDDQWYREEMAGLAEVLEGEIVRVRLPDSETVEAQQFGPDPIVQMTEEPYAGADIDLPRAIGAIGYTFDTDTQAPLFGKTAFVQPAPRISIDGEDQDVDLSWHFLQLRYRRRIDERAGVPNVSDWTEPTWVQILPPCDRFRVQEGQTIERRPVLDLVYDAGLARVHVRSNPQSKILPTKSLETEVVKPAFTLFALVTRTAPDAFGRSDSESYVDFTPLEALKKYTDNVQGLRVRLVELQQSEPIAPDRVFEALFPTAKDGEWNFLEDQKARVVRVSPPILAI